MTFQGWRKLDKPTPIDTPPAWVYRMAAELVVCRKEMTRQGVVIEALLDRLKLSNPERRALLAAITPKEIA